VQRDLRAFSGSTGITLTRKICLGIWFVFQHALFKSSLFPAVLRPKVLNIFGASVGRGVLIRRGVRIHMPWNLTIGDDCWIGEEVCTYKKLQEGERFIGLGEKTGNLDRRGEGYTNWNTDYFGYPANGDPLYSSIPFYMGIHHGLVYGVFLDNTSKTHFNFGASIKALTKGGILLFTLLLGYLQDIIVRLIL
jgi:hypothetical protein